MAKRQGREGSRWYNQRPKAEDVISWFKGVTLHEGMVHEDFLDGITLIPGKEKSDEVTGFNDQGHPLLKEREDLVYTPYIKVETRIAYFWRLVMLRGWVAEILPVPVPASDELGLPPGFFRYAAQEPKANPRTVTFVGCAMQVRIFERSRTELADKLILAPPPGTKIVPAATKWDVDRNALMKAETGAIGRALGVAGMLAVPGSGVATAEDLAESINDTAGASQIVAMTEPTLPEVTPAAEAQAAPADDDELRQKAADLVRRLQDLDPKRHQAFTDWARGRKLTLATAQGHVLRGVVRRLERDLAAAEEAPA